jgi:hypothetical protein
MARIQNYDSSTHLFWFRKLQVHPVAEFQAKAAIFRDLIAADLRLAPPYPQIAWFSPVAFQLAKKQWLVDRSMHPEADWDIDGNPFLAPSDFFRWPDEGEGPEDEIFCGYTHKDGPLIVGVAIEPEPLLSIAHECKHVAQDQHRPGWRMVNIVEAEAEAEAYVESVRTRFSDWLR